MIRPRRLRKNKLIRELVRDIHLNKENLIQPIFVKEGLKEKTEIKSFNGIYHHSIDSILYEVEELLEKGITKLLLFGLPSSKDDQVLNAISEDSIVNKTIREIKNRFKDDVYLISDVCLCAYTTHGHCGVLENGRINNDKSLKLLKEISLSNALSGVDMIAPSDMMDKRASVIRKALDKKGFVDTSIMSYSVKYNSSFYGPFRGAQDSHPKNGDRASYQMDYRYSKDAIIETLLDIKEGSDIVMVKPAMAYLDVISKIKEKINLPLAAYQVSGEYLMLKNAVKNNIMNKNVYMESLTGIKRAGADIIITYFAKELFSE